MLKKDGHLFMHRLLKLRKNDKRIKENRHLRQLQEFCYMGRKWISYIDADTGVSKDF